MSDSEHSLLYACFHAANVVGHDLAIFLVVCSVFFSRAGNPYICPRELTFRGFLPACWICEAPACSIFVDTDVVEGLFLGWWDSLYWSCTVLLQVRV